jgi:hypothetical protein
MIKKTDFNDKSRSDAVKTKTERNQLFVRNQFPKSKSAESISNNENEISYREK